MVLTFLETALTWQSSILHIWFDCYFNSLCIFLKIIIVFSSGYCEFLKFLYYHSSYSTLIALNIGHFGCGMFLRSGG